MSEPVEIMGVMAFPNENGKRDCRFIDSRYHTLFTVPDGGRVIITDMDGSERTLECRYIDDAHVAVGGMPYHICEFAEIRERKGDIYRPEHPKEGDCCDTYTVYQLKDTQVVPYGFKPHEYAKGKLHPAHYEKVYRGMFAPEDTLENLFRRHNADNRPFGRQMRSMSISDVVVIDRGGEKKAFYVDDVGFQEAKRFLRPAQKTKKRSAPER